MKRRAIQKFVRTMKIGNYCLAQTLLEFILFYFISYKFILFHVSKDPYDKYFRRNMIYSFLVNISKKNSFKSFFFSYVVSFLLHDCPCKERNVELSFNAAL